MNKETFNIYEVIKKEIVTLKKEPNAMIREVDVARKYNISRTPVRDIFSKLEYDGLIQPNRTKGTHVSKIDVDEITDTMYVITQVETNILNEIIDSITPGDIVKYKMIIFDQEELFNQDNLGREEIVDGFYDLQKLLIYLLYKKAGKQEIFDKFFTRNVCYRRFLYLIGYTYKETITETVRYSNLLLDALSKRDKKKVAEIIGNQKYIGLDKVRLIKQSHPNYFI